METNDINNTNDIKGKWNGFLGYLAMFLGFIIFLVLLSKLLTWLIG
jgi:hypothetical protein